MLTHGSPQDSGIEGRVKRDQHVLPRETQEVGKNGLRLRAVALRCLAYACTRMLACSLTVGGSRPEANDCSRAISPPSMRTAPERQQAVPARVESGGFAVDYDPAPRLDGAPRSGSGSVCQASSVRASPCGSCTRDWNSCINRITAGSPA